MGAVFLGTPACAIPSLAALAGVADVELVITQPDGRAPRSGGRRPPPVKIAAQQFGFEVAQPETGEALHAVIAEREFTVGVVVAYGRILTPAVLDALPYGFVNVHFSLLPRWRGPAPVERAIAEGDARTGATLMKIDAGIDTGPVLAETSTLIAPYETGGSLTARLSHLGASLIDTALTEYLNNRRRPVPQISSGVTHARRLTKGDAQIRKEWTAEAAERAIRAYQPRPTAWIATPKGTVRIHSASPTSERGTPGEIQLVGSHVIAGFASGALKLGTVQPEGRPRVDAPAWMHGLRGEPVSFQ
ncbi:MAG: methionyl-tRNA formyltransferase [Actinomycetota bacterium]|nr:methionyl-tRNA formyltransferase [Actinomycetota bacterium]